MAATKESAASALAGEVPLLGLLLFFSLAPLLGLLWRLSIVAAVAAAAGEVLFFSMEGEECRDTALLLMLAS